MNEVGRNDPCHSSLYREALNSNSSNYQFLCLYRLIEGLRERRNRLRTQVALQAKSEGKQPPSYPEERIPTDRKDQLEWLNALYPTPRDWDAMALESVFKNQILGRRYAGLRTFIQKAAESPEGYAVRERDLRRVNLERFPYHFFYRVAGDAVRILVVRHHKRRPTLGTHRR